MDLSNKFAQEDRWNLQVLDPSKQIGWLKHAFVLSYYFLLKKPQLSYEECIAETLLRAGDTDTNGAIVGGMIGAYYGKKALPEMMVDKVLNCDLTQGENQHRPPQVCPSAKYVQCAEKLFQKIPRTLKFI